MIKQTLLTAGNAKIIKGEKLGYVTKGIHFAPADFRTVLLFDVLQQVKSIFGIS